MSPERRTVAIASTMHTTGAHSQLAKPIILDLTSSPTTASDGANVDLTNTMDDPVVPAKIKPKPTIVDLTSTKSKSVNPEHKKNAVDGTATLHNGDVCVKLKLQCSVCLDDIDQLWSTKCGHVFCKGCIYASIKSTRRCPLCKQTLRTRHDVHRLFLWVAMMIHTADLLINKYNQIAKTSFPMMSLFYTMSKNLV